MNTKRILIVAVLMVMAIVMNAQENQRKDHLWTIKGKKKTHEVGMYASLSGNYTEIFGDPSFWLGAKVGVVFNQRWTIGFEAQGLDYEHDLTKLTDGALYRLEAGYAGMYIEFLQPIGDFMKIGVNVMSGQGVAQYRYKSAYREELEWYEEFIDRDDFAIFKPGAGFFVRVAGNWWAGVEASYTTTSPVQLKDTKQNFLENVNAGLSVTWGVF